MDNKPKLTLGAGRSLGAKPAGEQKKLIDTPAPEVKKPATSSSGKVASATQTITLSGTTKSGYPFDTLKLAQPVFLIRDAYGKVVKPDTGHDDPNAVSVQDAAENGKHIAYLPRRVAAVVSKALDSGAYTYEAEVAKIKGGYESEFKGEMLNWGVDVLLKFYRVEE